MRHLVCGVLKALFLTTAACQSLPPRLTFGGPRGDPAPSFRWDQPNDPYLVRLREEWGLERLRSGSDVSTVLAVSRWVSGQWEHDGRSTPVHSDPISILEEVRQGRRFRCVEYAVVLKGSLSALGIPSRELGLMRRDVETRTAGAGHVVVEAYLRDRSAWIVVDPQWNAAPFLGDQPLSAVLLQDALARGDPNLRFEGLPRSRWNEYQRWISPYLTYFKAAVDSRTVGSDPAAGAILLVPIGFPVPRVFERSHEIQGRPVSDVGTFYPVPLAEDVGAPDEGTINKRRSPAASP